MALAGELAAAEGTRLTTAAAYAPARQAARWTVRPGDTLSQIAAALGIPGGWPALYAANKAAVGPDPGLIQAGTVLALPGRQAPSRYTVAPGDTLSGIAAALGTPGGWPALYAANRAVIGPDPGVIRPGTVLAAPRPAAPAASPAAGRGKPPATPPAPAPAGTPRQASSQPAPGQAQPSAPGQATATAQPSRPARATAPGHAAAPAPADGMPRWLEDVLLAAGVLAATAFAAEPAAALARRRRPPGPARPRPAPAPPRGPARRAARKAQIILADHERLIVTYSAADHAVYVLTPPGEDPAAVLRAARLILPEDTYQDLAGHLGIPPGWPLE